MSDSKRRVGNNEVTPASKETGAGFDSKRAVGLETGLFKSFKNAGNKNMNRFVAAFTLGTVLTFGLYGDSNNEQDKQGLAQSGSGMSLEQKGGNVKENLRRFGLKGVDDNMASSLVKQGIIDEDEAAKYARENDGKANGNVKESLRKFGLQGVDDNTVNSLVKQGILDEEATTKYAE